MTALIAGLVGFAAFFNTVDLNTAVDSASESVGLDAWVAIKLLVAGVCGLIGAVGVVTDPVIRRTLVSMPGVILIALGCVFLATSVFALSEVATVCRAAAMIYVAYLLVHSHRHSIPWHGSIFECGALWIGREFDRQLDLVLSRAIDRDFSRGTCLVKRSSVEWADWGTPTPSVELPFWRG